MRNRTGIFVIFGGAGFIGTALTRGLSLKGNKVFVVGRQQPSHSFPETAIFCNAADLDSLRREIAPGIVEAVIDLAYATVPSTSVQDPVRDFSENLGCLLHDLEFAKYLLPRRYVFVSSGGTIYGDRGEESVSEESQKLPISPYGITKLACEHYAFYYRRLHQLPVVIARPSNVYGPGQVGNRGQGLVATAFTAALSGESLTIYGDGSQVRDFLYIDDCVLGLDALIEVGEPGEAYNLASGTAISVKHLLRMVESIVSRAGHRLSVSYTAARPFDVPTVRLDSEKVRRASGWSASTPIERGLESTWDWISSQ